MHMNWPLCQLMLEGFFHPKNMTYDNCWQHNAVAPLEAVISEWWLTVFIQTNKQKLKCSVLCSALWMVHVNYSRVSAIQEDSFPNNKSFLMHSFILMTAGSSDTLFILSIYYIFPSLLICDSLYNKGDHCDELLYNFIIITLTEKVGRCVCVCVL